MERYRAPRGWTWVPSRSSCRGLGVIPPYFDLGSTPHRAPCTKSRLFAPILFISDVEMGDQEKTYEELVGVRVKEMIVKCGGRQWALESYGEHVETTLAARYASSLRQIHRGVGRRRKRK